jgi:hypothetical protein
VGVPSPPLFLAAAGDYRLAVDLQPDPAISVLGLALLQREGCPAALGVALPIIANPDGPLIAEHCGQALTLGPAYKEADGAWVTLAGMPCEWADISHETLAETEERVEFEVEYRVGGGPTLWERYRLQADGLFYETRIRWVVGGFRLQMPVFLTDGRQAAVPQLDRNRLIVRLASHTLAVVAEDESERWELEASQYVNSNGVHQNAYLQGRSAVAYAVHVRLE